MWTRMFPLQTVLAAMVATGLLVGCGQNGQTGQTGQTEQAANNGGAAQGTDDSGQSHDPHDVPLTEEEIAQLKEDTAQYEDAIAHIKKFQKTIEQETTEGEPAKAHRALDHLDVVLERLPEAAQQSGVPKSKWQEVNETAQKLRDLFNQVHANIDAGENPDYESVAGEINQGVQSLAAIEPEQTE